MATTKKLNLSQQWILCATGGGDACLSAADEVLWIISDSAATLALTHAHLARTGDLVPMRLAGGE